MSKPVTQRFIEKSCGVCNTTFRKNPKYSRQQWSEAKFCSRPCQYKGKDMSNFVPPLRGKKNPACAGPRHPFWKGGVTLENDKIRRSFAYKEWRRQVFERDSYTCQGCGQRGGTLNADHIKPFAVFTELRFEVSNGRTLCVPCHRKTWTYGDAKRTRQLIDTLAEGKTVEQYLATILNQKETP